MDNPCQDSDQKMEPTTGVGRICRTCLAFVGIPFERRPVELVLIRECWVTAYHSFGGEVETSNTSTIRRLTLQAVTNYRA
jgi:hypothetical protein